jgi:hypothetical protein
VGDVRREGDEVLGARDPVAVARDPRALEALERRVADPLPQRVEDERAAGVDVDAEQRVGLGERDGAPVVAPLVAMRETKRMYSSKSAVPGESG